METIAAAAVLATAALVLNPATATAAPAHLGFTAATFETFSPEAKAVTYNAELVVPGSRVTVISVPMLNGSTTVTLRVRGLVPDRTYGSHVHTKACGALPADAGPHYQHETDPVQPSVDPNYANPRNEIWLDLTTDARGNGSATATVPWQFIDRHAQSVVIHAEHTHTGEGHAGTAGARLACANVDF